MFSSIFGDLEEPEAWRGVAVRVDHDVPGAGDGQVLASLVAAWVAMCNIFYVSQNTWVAIRALEQLVPVLAHHHQVGHPDVAHLGKKSWTCIQPNCRYVRSMLSGSNFLYV